jgi:hypothetical protein
MRTNRLIVLGLVMLTCGTSVFGGTQRMPDPGPLRTLEDAEPSAEQLIDQFLGALARKDPDALHRLRVTETEYREILMPTSVPEGQPLRQPSKEFADLAWGLIDEKSRYYEQSLLAQYGGRQLRLATVSYDKGDAKFAGYTARRQLRLALEDVISGERVEIATGSIAEVAGRYKFVSFIRD